VPPSSITRSIWLLVGIAVTAILLLAAATVTQIYETAAATKWVEHTLEVIAAVNGTRTAFVDAQTSERDYVLTGDAADATRYRAVATGRGAMLEALKRLTADNPVQQATLAGLAAPVEAAFAAMDQAVAATRAGRDAQADALLRRQSANDSFGRIRRDFLAMVTVERSLLAQRKTDARRAASHTRIAILVGVTLTLALILVAGGRLTGRLKSALGTLIQGITVVGEGDLAHHIPEGRPDEIGRIASAFNALADRLEHIRRVRDHTEEELQRTNENLRDRTAELERRNTAIDLLGRMAHRLLAAADEEEFGTIVARFVPQILPGIPGALYLFNNSRNLLLRTAWWDDPLADADSFAPDACWSLRRGQFHQVTDTGLDVCCAHVPAERVTGYVCLPLQARGDIIGLLYLESPAVPGLTAGHGYDYTGVLAENIALALANHRLNESLKEQSIRDPLTGLFNRRYFEEAAQIEFARARRSHNPVALLMIDIDHFKRFNDTFGHEAGDEVLREVAQTLRRHLRAGDLVCRLGGEEFAAMLPGSDSSQAVERGDVLRQAVKAIILTHHGQSLDQVSISVGVAARTENGDDPAVVLAAADGALYAAKRDGRDRVATATADAPAAAATGARNPPSPGQTRPNQLES
jgi:diguanylate cyclase (GGDEF)-like protein